MLVQWKGRDSASLFRLLLVTCNQSDSVVGGTLSETGANANIKEVKIANIDQPIMLYTQNVCITMILQMWFIKQTDRLVLI